jgi:hypothetical protein
LKCFEPGWSLERKTDIKQFGMLDVATPGTLRIVADAVINALWSARSLAAPAFE